MSEQERAKEFCENLKKFNSKISDSKVSENFEKNFNIKLNSISLTNLLAILESQNLLDKKNSVNKEEKFYRSLLEQSGSIDSQWVENSNLLIYGKTDPNGNRNLYLTRVKNIKSLDRERKNAILYEGLWRIVLEGGKLVTKSVEIRTGTLKNLLNMSGWNIGLNNEKTPLWYKSVKEINIHKLLKEEELGIKNLKNINL